MSHFADPGRSAFRGGNRKRGPLAAFLAASQAGDLGEDPHLLIERGDRLSREPAIDSLLFVLQELTTAGVVLVVTSTNTIYSRQTLTETPWLLQQLVSEAIGAHEYSRLLSLRLRAAHARARTEGRLIGAAPAWVRDPALVPLVLEIFERSERGEGATRTARILNERGVPTFTGRTWTPPTIRALLARPQLCGDLKRKDGSLVRDFWPPVVSRERWEASRGRRGPSFAAESQVLWVGQGLTYCAICNRNLGVNASTSRGKVTRRHYHLRCRTPSCPAPTLKLWEASIYLLERITGPSLDALLAPPPTGPDPTEGPRRRLEAADSRIRALQAAMEATDDPAALVHLAASLATAAAARETAAVALREASDDRVGPGPAPATSWSLHDVETRRTLNTALHRWGLRVTVDGTCWGLELPGRPVVWGTYREIGDHEGDAIGEGLTDEELDEISVEAPEWAEAYRAARASRGP